MIQLVRHIREKIKRLGLLRLIGKGFYILRNEGVSGLSRRVARMAGKEEERQDGALLLAQSSEAYYQSLAQQAKAWPHKPLISILLPVYNTPENWLRQAIDSVTHQIYEHWELCIADDASTQPHVRQVLEEYRQRDARIKVAYRATNGQVSAASNSALELATGAYTALLDHDDMLERHALYRLAEVILVDCPDMMYSDEAFIAEQSGEVTGHAFRPAFSLELLRAHSYIVRLAAFKTRLLRDIGGFDPALIVSQDYDLMLRAAEQAKIIVHLPEVLYCRRTHEDLKQDKAVETSKSVVAAHLARCGEKAEVGDGTAFGFFDVRYALEPGLRVAVIIPTKNHGDLVRQCVESIARTTCGVQYDIVVVDHASDDPSTLAYFDELRTRHRVLRYACTFNFSTINNWAIAQLGAAYTHYLLCNNDIEAITPGWLERMLELGQKRDIGIVGAKLYYPDGHTIQHAGVCVGMFGIAEHYGKFMEKELPDGQGIYPGYLGSLIANREMSSVTAACLLIRRDAFEWIAGFDEALAVGFGDVDLCLRARQAGYRIVFCAQAELIHHESFTRGKDNQHPEDSSYFVNRWQTFINEGDPYYNPNLTLLNTFWHTRKPEEGGQEIGKKGGWRVFRKVPNRVGTFSFPR